MLVAPRCRGDDQIDVAGRLASSQDFSGHSKIDEFGSGAGTDINNVQPGAGMVFDGCCVGGTVRGGLALRRQSIRVERVMLGDRCVGVAAPCFRICVGANRAKILAVVSIRARSGLLGHRVRRTCSRSCALASTAHERHHRKIRPLDTFPPSIPSFEQRNSIISFADKPRPSLPRSIRCVSSWVP